MRLPQDGRLRPSKLGAEFSAPALLLGGTRRRPQRLHQRSDHVPQRKPVTFVRHDTHCSRCFGRPAASPASRLAIRKHLFARAARRADSSAGPSMILGEDGNADATGRGRTRSDANATLRRPTDADATDSSRNRRNADATTLRGSPAKPPLRRTYRPGTDDSVPPGTRMAGERLWRPRIAFTES